jgi:S-adenosylmethionine/arginine decarboxylase-like enzyme
MNGLHLTADLYGCANAAALVDIDGLAAFCHVEVKQIGLTAVGDRWYRFPDTAAGPGGVTGAVLLAESHIAVHTWPERAGVTLDIYVCNYGRNNSARAEALLGKLIAHFAPAHFEQGRMVRGALDGNDVRSLELREASHPLDADLQRQLAQAYEAAGDAVKAAAAKFAAEALATRQPALLHNLATGYFRHGHVDLAEKWYRVTLALDATYAAAHENLASILRDRGEATEAQQHLHAAYQQQWLFDEAGSASNAKVLLLCAAGLGNVPVDHTLPVDRFGRVRCMVEYAPSDALAHLPACHIVFNLVGDPDVPAAGDERLGEILRGVGRPILNDPQAVALTRRDRLPARLAGIANTVVPEVRRIELSGGGTDALLSALAGATYPLILRPAASHGGQGVVLVRTTDDIRHSGLGEAEVVYATTYHEFASAEGLYRKYRIIYVDGRPYPYHLAISSTWLVHYFSADMLAGDWKLEEEQRFLADPEAAVGAQAMRAIEAIGERLGLHYGGIDFSILPDGRVLVFEANATMLVHPERADGPLAHKNVYVQKIIDATAAMVKRYAC